MNSKLYYKDAYSREFNATIMHHAQDDAGMYVVLESTLFYPTGGGQPCDTGLINDRNVLNVEEVDGEIRHYVDGEIVGNHVKGILDWERRFDHMQQHSGQHILSAAFAELFKYETINFHLGREVVSIDLQTETISESEIELVEALANKIVLENRIIQTKWVSQEELNQYPLRKQPSVTEEIRLVIIPEFDYNGCGGIHPKSTGEVIAMKVLKWERQKNSTRVYFVCGSRVLRQLHEKTKVISELNQLLSSPQQELVETIKLLLSKRNDQDKTIEGLREELIHLEAKEIARSVDKQLIGLVFEHRTIQELQKLARSILAECANKPVFLITEGDNRIQMVFARGKNSNLNMKELIGDVLSLINGKGGGNEMMAQGGGERSISGEEILSYIQEKLVKSFL